MCLASALCIIVQLGHMLSTILTYTYEASREHEQKAYATCIVGTVDVCGYDTQLKYCDTCAVSLNSKHIEACIFRHHGHIRYIYNFLWCLDLQVWRFLCPRWRQHGGQITELLQALHCYTPMLSWIHVCYSILSILWLNMPSGKALDITGWGQ